MSSRGVTFGGDLETKRKAPEPRIPRTTLRQQRSDRYEARWNWKAALRRRRAERRKKKGQHAKDKKLPPVRGSDARIVENGFATSGGLSRSAKVVLGRVLTRPRPGDSQNDREGQSYATPQVRTAIAERPVARSGSPG